MISKNQVFLGMAAALSASAIAIAPAQAESVENDTLIAQLRGYEFYSPIEVYKDDWLTWRFMDDIAVGRVVAKVGDICTVKFISPTNLRSENDWIIKGSTPLACDWTIRAGDDVIAGYDDDGWTLLDEDDYPYLYHAALPAWVTRLDLKEEVEVQRTAIDWGDSRQVELPPLRPQAVTPAPTFVPEPAPEPIRGMW